MNVILERIPRLEDPLDQLLALLVARMGLAGVDDLQAAGFGGDAAQPVQVAEQQVGALVGRRPAREPERQHVHIQSGVVSRLTYWTSSRLAAQWACHTSGDGIPRA